MASAPGAVPWGAGYCGGTAVPCAGVAIGRCTGGAGAHGPGPPYGGVLYSSGSCNGCGLPGADVTGAEVAAAQVAAADVAAAVKADVDGADVEAGVGGSSAVTLDAADSSDSAASACAGTGTGAGSGEGSATAAATGSCTSGSECVARPALGRLHHFAFGPVGFPSSMLSPQTAGHCAPVWGTPQRIQPGLRISAQVAVTGGVSGAQQDAPEQRYVGERVWPRV